MTQEEFANQMARMINVYTAKAFPPEREKILFQKMKFKHAEVFKIAVEFLIAEYYTPPSLSKILDAVKAAEYERPDLKSDPYAAIKTKLDEFSANKNQCPKCWNTGIVTVYCKFIEGFPMKEFICTCDVGPWAKKLPDYRMLMAWNDQFKKLFVLHTDFIKEHLTLERSKALDLPREKRIEWLMNQVL